jgi:hypothetical protein
MKSTSGLVLPSALDDYVAELDRVLPATAVAGVYLTGSTALDDYRHGQSDLDILTVTQYPLSESELDALDAMHRRLENGAQPHLDARYVPREHVGKLVADATDAAHAPGHAYVVDGEFHRGASDQDLVVWAILDQCGITLRGPEAKSWHCAPDAARLRAWTMGNLESYWRANSLRAREVLAARLPGAEFSTYAAVWTATGPGRLHRTIATGEIISKSAAAHYTADLFPAYAPILMRAKASRFGDESVGFVTRDGLALMDMVDELCDDAARLAARAL